MKINLQYTNMDSSSAIDTYVDMKIGELDKYINIKESDVPSGVVRSTVAAFVEVGKTTRGQSKGDVYRAEVQLRMPGSTIRSESTQLDLHRAIDEVKDELQRQLRRYKEKQSAKFLRGARRIKNLFKDNS